MAARECAARTKPLCETLAKGRRLMTIESDEKEPDGQRLLRPPSSA